MYSVGPVSADIDFEETFWEVGTAWAITANERTRWELIGGARYLDYDYDGGNSSGYAFDASKQGSLAGITLYW